MSAYKSCNNCNTELPFDMRGMYCSSCFSIRKEDLCEIIDESGIKIYNKDNVDQLHNYLEQHNIIVRLDLHGVLDTIDYNVLFDHPESMCCISFVGSTTKTRISARQDILNRLGKQISYGVLVFSRGGSSYHKIGSKAWVNEVIPLPTNKKGLFLDDSGDHYESVKSLKINNLDCRLYNKQHKNLYKLINQYIK